MTIYNTDERPATDWTPIDSGEIDYVEWDFTDRLDDGETISSVETTCEIVRGADEDADTRLLDTADINGPLVRQFFSSDVDGAEYLCRCVATTSADRALVLAGRLPVLKIGAAI